MYSIAQINPKVALIKRDGISKEGHATCEEFLGLVATHNLDNETKTNTIEA